MPGECFPTRYRSTSHGISAASGKLGAIVAQVVFGPLATRGLKPHATGRDTTPWLNHIMEIFALFMLCGLLTTLLIPETKRKTLEELCGERAADVEQPPPEITPDMEEMLQGPPLKIVDFSVDGSSQTGSRDETLVG